MICYKCGGTIVGPAVVETGGGIRCYAECPEQAAERRAWWKKLSQDASDAAQRCRVGTAVSDAQVAATRETEATPEGPAAP